MDFGKENSRKHDWGSLPYPVIHAIAKFDLQKVAFRYCSDISPHM